MRSSLALSNGRWLLSTSVPGACVAFGGWVSGAIFDATGSYRAAFVNGIAWNLLNMSIAFWLLRRALGNHAQAAVNWPAAPRP